MIPHERDIRADINRLRDIARKPPHLDNRTGLDILETRILEARRRALSASPTPDGYAATTLATGSHGSAELTSVEASANALIFADPIIDQVHQDAEQAIGFLHDAAAAIGACIARLDHLDRISTPQSRSATAGTGHCQACGRWVPGSASDRLVAGYCDTDYRAWIRAGRPDRTTFKRTHPPTDVRNA